MKIKLDENLGLSAKNLLVKNGFDVLSVLDQKISGIPDEQLFQLVRSENRCFITLDKDFSDVVRFNSNSTAGIVVLRIAGRLSVDLIIKALQNFIEHSKIESPVNNTWIVELDKIRIHQKE